MRVFVPQPIPQPTIDRLERFAEQVEVFPELDRRITKSELRRAVSDQDVLYAISGVAYDDEVIAAANDLRLIAAMHVSATFVDKAAATRRGVPVTGISNGNLRRTTAEFTFALVMATAWRLPEADRFLREGRWAQNQSMALLGHRLFGKTLGVVGLGEIGLGVARRARANEMRVLYNKRTRLDPRQEAAEGVEYRDLETLFSESDVVVVCVALTEQTRGLVGSGLLGRMKSDALFVNTSRGAVVDEAALEAVLADGRIAGAGLDVFAHELGTARPGPRSGLLELPNVVLTPHIGSAAIETRQEMADEVADCIEAFHAGQRPPRVLNPEVYGDAPREDEVIG